ncbi:MAG: L,D-transpeptidase [Gammaproteobacteria bacterium]|nr:L,D-transpeptidase [Gammaproteobacteria bacterium]
MQTVLTDASYTAHCRAYSSPYPAFQGWARTFLFILVVLAAALAPRPSWSDGGEEEEVWLQVDTQALILRVMRGQQPIKTYEDIAIGRFGTTADKRHLDGKTQLGEFHVSLIKNTSLFHRFFGLDYPQLDQAERALKRGELPLDQYKAIHSAVRAHRTPPQNTALGGHLGIHGIGAGDPKVHEAYNWTNGCIALTNRQVDELAQWMRLGVRVVIY